jgi:oligosaccharide repeat unit polymerase
VPEKVDFIHGSSYLALLTLPVPRAIWPEKPGMVDGRVGEAFYGVTYGIPPGPIGEAYWNFGIPGILLVFFLLGAFYKWLSEWFQQYAQQPTVLVLYIITLFQLAELSSSAILDWLLGLVPFLIILRLIGAIAFRRTNHENQERSQTV